MKKCRGGNSCRFRNINSIHMNQNKVQWSRNPEVMDNYKLFPRMQNSENGRKINNHISRNIHTEHKVMQFRENTEDFLWSRFNIGEKRQIIGMMPQTLSERKRRN